MMWYHLSSTRLFLFFLSQKSVIKFEIYFFVTKKCFLVFILLHLYFTSCLSKQAQQYHCNKIGGGGHFTGEFHPHRLGWWWWELPALAFGESLLSISKTHARKAKHDTLFIPFSMMNFKQLIDRRDNIYLFWGNLSKATCPPHQWMILLCLITLPHA